MYIKIIIVYNNNDMMLKANKNSRAEEERGEHITRRTKKNGEKSIYFPTSQNLWYNIINKGNNTTRECKKLQKKVVKNTIYFPSLEKLWYNISVKRRDYYE